MKNELGTLLLICISVVTAEIVYLEDNNANVHKRTFENGLSETLDFNLRYAGDLVSLKLRENKRLNANAPIYEEVTLEDGTKKIQRNINIPSNKDVRYYQDLSKGAYMSVECLERKGAPCTRILTGNLYYKGKEYTLEPVMEELNNKREIPSHLGTPHRMEPLSMVTRKAEVKVNKDGSKIMESVRAVPGDKYSDDFEVYDAKINESVRALPGDKYLDDFEVYTPDSEATTAPTTTEDYGETREQMEHEKRVASDYLLEKLLQRLEHRQKRQAPVAHGVEVLLTIDHVIYNEFATRYSGDETIKYKIREYYSHIINGVDIRYASIQENDISIYVVISGFYISSSETTSPWMDYNQNPTAGSAGLRAMIDWRKRADLELPNHDHAFLITGSNIAGSSGNAGVVGIAYLDGVCRDNRVSINEEMGFFQGAGVLAHELGHNLGAPHDSGVENGPCDPEAYYLMAPYVAYVYENTRNTQPWQFSRCSVQSFRDYFNELSQQNNDCTLNRGVIYDQDEYDMHTAGYAGQLYTVTQQCELLTGVGASFCGSNENTPNICRNLRCQRQGGSCGRYIAAHGTPCGNDMLCFRGICSEHSNGTFVTPTPGPTPPPTTAAPTTPPTPCGGDFTAPTGVLTTLNHPNSYPNNRECVYKIMREEGERIQLKFTAFDVEDNGCRYDYLEVRNGESPDSALMGIYCGTNMPPDMISIGNAMYLKFVTDATVVGSGFRIEYESIGGGPGPTPGPPDGYSCSDVGVGNSTCQDLRTLMGNPVKMCINFFGQCCQYCYQNNGCKKDKVVKGASKYKCADLVASLGMEQTCWMFPYHCCKTCKDFATGGETR